jgi:hypothetical protein
MEKEDLLVEIGTGFYVEKTPKTSYLEPSQRNTTTKMAQSCCKDNVSEFHEEEPSMLNAVANGINDVREVTEGTGCDSSETHGQVGMRAACNLTTTGDNDEGKKGDDGWWLTQATTR